MSSTPFGGWGDYLLTGKVFRDVVATVAGGGTSGIEGSVLKSMLEAKKEADGQRRAAMAERISLYQDDCRSLVRRKLTAQYEFDNRIEIFKSLDLSNNLLKKIIAGVSTIYDEPPTWEMAQDDGGAWKEIREDSRLNLTMPVVNQYTNLCNECFLLVTVADGALAYRIITPDLMFVEQDPEDPTRPIAIWYWSGNVDTHNDTGYWHYWDKNPIAPAHHVYDEKFRIVDEKFGVDGINPYRDEDGNPVIPGVMYHKSLPINTVWDRKSGDDLTDGTVMLMAMETIINHVYRTDGAAIKWIAGRPDEEAMKGQTIGALKPMILRASAGETVNAGQWASQGDWAGLRQVVNDKASNLANNYGLSLGAITMEGSPASGFSLKVRKEPLLEIRKRQIPLYATYDRELYGVVWAVLEIERLRATTDAEVGQPANPSRMLKPSEADPKIKYSDFQTPLTVEERAAEFALLQQKLSMGLLSVLDVYRTEHPDATDLESEAAIKANLEINAKYLPGAELVGGRAQVLPTGAAAQVGPDGKPLAAAAPAAPPAPPVNPMHALIASVAAKHEAAKQAKAGKP